MFKYLIILLVTLMNFNLVSAQHVLLNTTAPPSNLLSFDEKNGLEFDGRIDIYPNPVKDELHINVYLEVNNVINIHIVDILGNILFKTRINSEDNLESHLRVDMRNMAPGLYFLRIASDANVSLKTIKINRTK